MLTNISSKGKIKGHQVSFRVTAPEKEMNSVNITNGIRANKRGKELTLDIHQPPAVSRQTTIQSGAALRCPQDLLEPELILVFMLDQHRATKIKFNHGFIPEAKLKLI